MDKKNIFLIGGGEIAQGETKKIDDEIMRLAPKGAKFVFFGTAAGDSDGYVQTMTSVFGDYFEVITATKEKGREFSVEAIRTATVIYFGGGITKLLMDHFEDWNMVSFLKKAIDRGAIIAGMSAGAQALATWYVHEEGDLQEIRQGWNLIPGSIGVLVHATQNSFSRAQKLCKEKGASKLYGIGERSALLCSSKNTSLIKVGDGIILE